MRGSASARLRHVLAGVAFSFSVGAAGAVDLQEPITLQSSKGVLDILLVAKAAAIPSLSPLNPTGWVYDICLNPHNGANDCPAVSGSPNLYGGTRLQLSQGDTLKIHLVNKLPPITDSDQAQDPDEAFLALNPTNIHTHGLLVSPRYPSKSDRSGAFDRWRWYQSGGGALIASYGANHWEQSKPAALSGRCRCIGQQAWRSASLHDAPSYDAEHAGGNQSHLPRYNGSLDRAATGGTGDLQHRGLRDRTRWRHLAGCRSWHRAVRESGGESQGPSLH
jgi:hypothetical protein